MAPASGIAIDIEQITVGYPGLLTPVLRDFSLQVGTGEVLAILGRSGAGKTTVLRAIAGFEKIQSGYMRVHGKLMSSNFVHMPPERRKVGFVFQDYALFPNMTIGRNVAFGAGVLPREHRRKSVAECLELTGITKLCDRYPHELSGGEQQRVALARALASKPIVLLLDEPFSNLDTELRQTLRNEVRRIAKTTNVTTLLVSHSREDALSIADKIGIMCAGKVAQIGNPVDVYRFPCTADVAELCGPCNFINGTYSNGLAVTQAGNFNLGTTHSNSFHEGEALTLLIRPGDVDLNPDNESPLLVTSQLFNGDVVQNIVTLPDGHLVRVDKLSFSQIGKGERVKLSVRRGVELVAFKAF